MQYVLMLYVDEAGWPKLSKAEQEQGVAAYTAYAEALAGAGCEPLAAYLVCHNYSHVGRQNAGAG